MVFLENLKLALKVLNANKLRTLLTALSVALGALAITLMVSLSKSGVGTISAGIDAVGGRQIIFLDPKEANKSQTKNYDKGLTRADAEAIAARVPGIAEVAYLNNVPSQIITAGDKKAEIEVLVGETWKYYIQQKVIYGKNIPKDEDLSVSRVVLLPQKLARELFGQEQEALGKTIVLWGHRYQVLGVTESHKSMSFQMVRDPDHVAIFPINAMIKHEGIGESGYIIVKSNGTVSHDLMIRLMHAILLERHRGVEDVIFEDLAADLARFDMILVGLQVITGLIAAVALLIAGVGVMNVMLASVKQRVVEIGIRRAIGASKDHIQQQFLIESLTISFTGGLIGCVSGLLLALLINVVVRLFLNEWRSQVSLGAALVSVLVSLLCGFVFGLKPAKEAARLDVVSCIRGEI